jgi:hypothetical protein
MKAPKTHLRRNSVPTVCLFESITNIVADAASEQHRLLTDERDVSPKPFRVIKAEVTAVNQHTTC